MAVVVCRHRQVERFSCVVGWTTAENSSLGRIGSLGEGVLVVGHLHYVSVCVCGSGGGCALCPSD